MMVSIAFVVVTVLYTTSGSSVCSSDTISDNAHVKKLVHVDLLNYDNSHNGYDKQEVEEDEMQHTVLFECGHQAIFCQTPVQSDSPI